jgi:hypothetical protein
VSDPSRGSDVSQLELTVGDLAAGKFCLAKVGRLRLLGLARGGPALEAQFHQRFAEARKRGEWFAPVQPLLDLAASSRYVPARAHGKKWRSIVDGWF